MKVVFDTNIFVSAFTLPGGSGERALLNIVDGRDSLALSKPKLDALLSLWRVSSHAIVKSRRAPRSF